jgi:hypothetical protein
MTSKEAKDAKKWAFNGAAELLDHVLGLNFFHPRGRFRPAIPFHRVSPPVQKGKDESKLVVVVGENASGKSFFRRLVRAVCSKAAPDERTECIHLSMEGRMDSSAFGGLRSMVYGSEQDQSTGENSVGTVLGGITTCKERKGSHIVVWDEPDLGLSDSWAAGMGEAIRDFAKDPGEHTRAIVLVSHRRALLAPLLTQPLHYVHLGMGEGAPASLEAWFEQPIIPRDIRELKEESLKRWRAIQTILNENEKRRREEER